MFGVVLVDDVVVEFVDDFVGCYGYLFILVGDECFRWCCLVFRWLGFGW